MAEQQGQFDIEPILDRPAPPCHGAPHSVLHRVEMQVKLLGGKRITDSVPLSDSLPRFLTIDESTCQ
jgi:hypothetical protein